MLNTLLAGISFDQIWGFLLATVFWIGAFYTGFRPPWPEFLGVIGGAVLLLFVYLFIKSLFAPAVS